MSLIRRMCNFLFHPPPQVVRGEYKFKLYRLAEREAQRFAHEYVGMEHLFLVIAGITRPEGARELRKRIPEGPGWVLMGQLPPNPSVRAVMDEAIRYAKSDDRTEIEVADLWLGIKNQGGEEAADWAKRLGFDLSSQTVTSQL